MTEGREPFSFQHSSKITGGALLRIWRLTRELEVVDVKVLFLEEGDEPESKDSKRRLEA
jgi:hypothetical protein